MIDWVFKTSDLPCVPYQSISKWSACMADQVYEDGLLVFGPLICNESVHCYCQNWLSCGPRVHASAVHLCQLHAAHRLDVFFHGQLFWFFAECTEAQSGRDARQPWSTQEEEGVTVPLVLDNSVPIVNWPGWTNRWLACAQRPSVYLLG